MNPLVSIKPGMKVAIKPIALAGYNGFALFDQALGLEAGLIASGFSARMLSDWALNMGAKEVKFDFDLGWIEK